MPSLQDEAIAFFITKVISKRSLLFSNTPSKSDRCIHHQSN
jgi:hypothetical protein